MDTLLLEQSKILLIGDSCIDEYIFGDARRMSPEAPVPVLFHNTKKTTVGMASNVLKNLENISESKHSFITNPPDKIRKIRFVDEKSKYQIMRYDIEEKIQPLLEKDLPDSEYDAIIVSDYDKGFIDNDIVNVIRRKYPKSKIFVDTKKRDVSPFSGCTIKLNESEYHNCYGKDDTMEFVVTLGPNGAQWNEKVFSTKNVDVHDVCGAGDVFLSTLVWTWLETNSMEEAIIFANKCASYSVTKIGTYQITSNEYSRLRNEK